MGFIQQKTSLSTLLPPIYNTFRFLHPQWRWSPSHQPSLVHTAVDPIDPEEAQKDHDILPNFLYKLFVLED